MADRKTAFFTLEARDHALPFAVTTVGVNCHQNGVIRENGYAFFHFFRCLGGAGRIEAGTEQMTLSKGMGLILFPDEPHQYAPLAGSEPWLLDWITFGGPAVSGTLSWLGIDRSQVFDLQLPSVLSADLDALRDIMQSSKPTMKMDLSCQLYRILADLYWSLPAGHNQNRVGQYHRLEPVIQHIDRQFGDPLTLDQLAGIAGVSPRHLCFLFREILHVRPFWYVNAVRINRSKHLLLEERQRPISETAAICGYTNICYFNQTFRKMTGMSPTQFRSRH